MERFVETNGHVRIFQQGREHSVPCSLCHRPTWNPSAVCDICKEEVMPSLRQHLEEDDDDNPDEGTAEENNLA